MALGSTIYKAELAVADIGRAYYADHALAVARHPSETEERLMVRVLAFALHADEALRFGRGLSAHDEPDLWQKDATGVIELWIEVGLPDERAVRKACGRARRVAVLAYGGRRLEQWWQQNAAGFERHQNLDVLAITPEESAQLAGLAQRSMTLSCTVQEGSIWLASQQSHCTMEIRYLQRASDRHGRN